MINIITIIDDWFTNYIADQCIARYTLKQAVKKIKNMQGYIREGVKNKKIKIFGIFQIEVGGFSEGSISNKKKYKKMLL